MIKIKCDYRCGAVAVPTEVIDKHLKLAPAASFKVLLFIFRNPDCTSDAARIAMCTGLAVEDVCDCLAFWENNGVIKVDSEPVSEEALRAAVGNAKCACVCEEKCVETEKKQPVAVRNLPVKKPTQREIAMRIQEEPELTLIYNEAQSILGTFGYDTQALLLMIYDYYGFPPEVIVTLIQHQKCVGKTSSSAIKTRAEDWAKRGIDTLEEVEKELLILENVNKAYKKIREAAGLEAQEPSPRIFKFLRQWIADWGCSEELVEYALAQSDKVFSDAGKLLKKWAGSGIATPQQVEEKLKKTLPKEVKQTYNIEKVGKNSVLEWAKRFSAEEENE